MSVFGVILERIFPHSDWIRTRITPNTYTFYAVSDAKILKQKRRNSTKVIHKVWIVLDCSSGTYFLEVSPRVSLRVVTNGLFRGKKSLKISIFHAIIVKKKQRSQSKKTEVSLTNLECSCLVQKCIFWKWVHTFHWK